MPFKIEKDHEAYKIDIGGRIVTVRVSCESVPKVMVDLPIQMGSYDDWIILFTKTSEALKKLRFDLDEKR